MKLTTLLSHCNTNLLVLFFAGSLTACMQGFGPAELQGGSVGSSSSSAPGTTTTALTPSPNGTTTQGSCYAPTGKFGVSVCGTKMQSTKDGSPIVLRGADVSAFEFAALSAYANTAQSLYISQLGTATPWVNMTQTWKMNTVRVPLEEMSWIADDNKHSTRSCADLVTGATLTPNGNQNYQSVIKNVVSDFTSNGMYVILDLHFAAPGSYCTGSQIQMADADHSLQFWAEIATAFKNNPAVIFDLYNEPYAPQGTSNGSTNMDSASESDWSCWLKGCSTTHIYGWHNGSGKDSYPFDETVPQWNTAGMQQMVDAIRGVGATNVIIAGGLGEAAHFNYWLKYMPQDHYKTVAGNSSEPVVPVSQIAASWHTYNIGGTEEGNIQGILSAGVPVVIGEFSNNQSGNVKATTSFADKSGNGIADIGAVAWCFDTWCGLRDANDNTSSEGALLKTWLQSH